MFFYQKTNDNLQCQIYDPKNSNIVTIDNKIDDLKKINKNENLHDNQGDACNEIYQFYLLQLHYDNNHPIILPYKNVKWRSEKRFLKGYTFTRII